MSKHVSNSADVLQTHARLDHLCGELEQLRVDTASVSRPAREAIASAVADVRDDVRATASELETRIRSLEAAEPGTATTGLVGGSGSPGRGKREAGLCKVLECSVRDAEARVLEAAARRGAAAEAAVTRYACALPALRHIASMLCRTDVHGLARVSLLTDVWLPSRSASMRTALKICKCAGWLSISIRSSATRTP